MTSPIFNKNAVLNQDKSPDVTMRRTTLKFIDEDLKSNSSKLALIFPYFFTF